MLKVTGHCVPHRLQQSVPQILDVASPTRHPCRAAAAQLIAADAPGNIAGSQPREAGATHASSVSPGVTASVVNLELSRSMNAAIGVLRCACAA
jgi:hypothetical protein